MLGLAECIPGSCREQRTTHTPLRCAASPAIQLLCAGMVGLGLRSPSWRCVRMFLHLTPEFQKRHKAFHTVRLTILWPWGLGISLGR